MMRKMLVITAVILSLPGCSTINSYWQKPTKYKQMPEQGPEQDKWVPPVSTLSLDASRRLVISQLVPGDASNRRITCPEPPPDVSMNILSQTLLNLETKAGASVDAQSMYQAISQVLSTRTSTVEAWRTTSSMYCVLIMNNKEALASEYLRASAQVIAATKDTYAPLPVAPTFKNPNAKAEEADAEAKKADDAAKAAKADAAAKEKAAADAKATAEKAKADALADRAEKITKCVAAGQSQAECEKAHPPPATA